MRAWYLIYSKPSQEATAVENLSRQGYEVYLPMLERASHRQSGKVMVNEAMFPRYLFARLSDRDDDWGPIRSTRGVAKLIRFGAIPARVPDDFIEALRATADARGLHTLPAPTFEPGEHVRICGGLMAGYEAVFAARSGKQRVLLLLNVAGTQARIQVPLEQIEPARAPS